MTSTTQPAVDPTAAARALGVEVNGINVIADQERKGHPRQLFWPWFAANVSVLGLGYGAYILAFGGSYDDNGNVTGLGLSFWQALIVGIVGVVVSFLLCGFVAVAGKRGSAPTLVLSRAQFGVRGNRLPAVISWMLTVGWETILVVLATLATASVFKQQLHWGGGASTEIVALVVVVALTIGAGVMGYETIMKLELWITVITGILTIVFIALSAKHIHWSTVSAIPSGSAQHVIGALVFVMTGFGLGWVNAAADYSRYLPRKSSTGGVVWWTTFGSALAPVILVVFGLLLAGSSLDLTTAINDDPIGALAQLLPTWFLVPFVIVAVLSLVGGSVLDIYSSGLSLLTAGIRIPRYAAAFVDGLIMIAGTIYVVFFAANFQGPFEAFLITLGVPIAAWAGVMLADILLRRKDYDEVDLYRPQGRYGDVRWVAIGTIVIATVLGWGLITVYPPQGWLQWQGYLLQPFGLGGRDGAWASANIGVLVALVLSFVATLVLGARRVRQQEALPPSAAPSVDATV